MATSTHVGQSNAKIGRLPATGSEAPSLTLTDSRLQDVSRADYRDESLHLNILPSLDASVCASPVRRTHEEATKLKNVKSYAFQRICRSSISVLMNPTASKT